MVILTAVPVLIQVPALAHVISSRVPVLAHVISERVPALVQISEMVLVPAFLHDLASGLVPALVPAQENVPIHF
jgi:hypothetical protein